MIRVMSGLREQRRTETRAEIVDAVHRVLVDEHPAELSMPRVAEEAGVSLRTLYRYFPSKADLVDAASRSYQVDVVAEVGEPRDDADLETYLRATWNRFDDSVAAVLAQHTTPAGRELRRTRLARSRTYLRGVVDEQVPGLDAVEHDRVVDTLVLLTSSGTYLELTQHLGHSSDDAAHLATEAVRAVLDAARRSTRGDQP